MVIPLFFTVARILIAPFLLQAICNHNWPSALILFSLGACSDFLDGFFARYLKQETWFGAAFDPVADKIFLLTVFYGLSLQVAYIPHWMIFCIVLKELVLMIGAAIVLYGIPGFVIKPLWHAKLVTVFSCVVLFLIMFFQMQDFCMSETMVTLLVYVWFAGNIYVLAEYGVKIHAQIKGYYARK